MSGTSKADFRPVGFWAPRPFHYWMVRPRLWKAVTHRPVAIRIAAVGEATGRSGSVVAFTFDERAHGRRMCLEFASPDACDLWRFRWRPLANALWRMVDAYPALSFHAVPVDASDCIDGGLHPDVFRFARRPGEPHELLPNPYLLERDRLRPRTITWEDKNDSVYFRGAATGSAVYEDNPRVVACLLAKSIPASDCRVVRASEAGEEFMARARRDGILTPRQDPAVMNRHRYILDVDGHSSSWDRFRRIGLCGSVPIRFETTWQEVWHADLVEGVHFVAATRHTLADVVRDLRANPVRAEAIATAAHRFVVERLSAAGVQAMLEAAWSARIGRC